MKYEHPINMWIGPSNVMLVQLGGLFPPCIRQDVLISVRNARYYSQEASGLGCCEIIGSGAGMCGLVLHKLTRNICVKFVFLNFLRSLT